MSIRSYIKNKKVKHFNIAGIEVYEKDQITNDVDVRMVLSEIIKRIPDHLLSNVDSIYIGSFDFLKERDVQAAYENSSIFITNEQDTEEDMMDDIVHEIAHSIEEKYAREIYEDQKIESEFLQKRKKTWMLLKDQGFDLELQYFLDTEYSKEFDEYLYMEIGYPLLAMLTSNLFYSPYAVTSLREYFANGFEAFFMKENIGRLKSVSPTLYKRITELLYVEDFTLG